MSASQNSSSLSALFRICDVTVPPWSGGVTPSAESLNRAENVHSPKDLGGGGHQMKVVISACSNKAF
jgi:hypothetical protein